MRQLLAMIPNVPCLYRYEANSTYYGIKKLKGKEKDICVGLGIEALGCGDYSAGAIS
jgi:hypothetical protein